MRHARQRGKTQPALLSVIAVGSLLVAVVCLQLYHIGKSTSAAPQAATCQVYFSPRGGCTDAIVQELNAAHSTVRVQAYSFTSAPIAKALVDAKKRGVEVQVILDKSQRTERYSSATFLLHAGIPTFIDDEHAIAHNKVMIIDGRTVMTGSFNFSKAAEERNAENLLVIRGDELASKYLTNWQAHLEHSTPYTGPSGAKEPGAEQ